MTARLLRNFPITLASLLAIVAWGTWPASLAAQPRKPSPTPKFSSPAATMSEVLPSPTFNINPNTPVKDLLPTVSDKAPSGWSLVRDLNQVPEVRFQDALSL